MSKLDTLWKQGKEFLGVRYPIMCGAMTWISESGLVSAVSNAGAFGCLAAGNMPPEELVGEIDKTKKLTDKPFAVNLITIAPNYKNHLRIAIEKEIPLIVFAGSFPRASEIKLAKENGAKVLCFASNKSIALRLIASGVDALLLEGSEAGGHIGHVSLAILLQEVLFEVDSVPVFVAGGIAKGQLMAHLLLMGAAGIQMGTRFVMTEECQTHPKFKQAFTKARARDAVATPAVGSELHIVAVRAIRNNGMDNFSNLQMDLIQKKRRGEINTSDAQYEVEKYWIGALRRAVQDGDVDTGSLMAGQSVGMMDEIQPLTEMLAEFIDQAEDELAKIVGRLQCY